MKRVPHFFILFSSKSKRMLNSTLLHSLLSYPLKVFIYNFSLFVPYSHFLTLILIFLLFLNGINFSSALAQGKITIAFVLATEKEERYKKDKAFFSDEAKKLGADVILKSASNSVEEQRAILKELINRRVNAIVVQPVDSYSLTDIVDLARKNQIPVIAYDRLIYDANIDFYVAHDSVMVGIIQAREAVKFTGGKGNFVILSGGKNHSVAKQITTGNLMIIDKYPSIKLLGIFYHEKWGEDEAYATMKDILSKTKDISAVLANNSSMIRGAIKAMEEAKLDVKSVFTAGADADLENCRLIVQEKQHLDILKDIEPLARAAAKVAFALAQKKIPESNKKINNGKFDVSALFIPVVPVTRENIEETIIKPGFHKREDIYSHSK